MFLRAALPVVLALVATTQVKADLEQRIVFDATRSLLTARMDPIIFPGVVSQHVHRIVGGSNFNVTYDPDALRNSTCSNLEPQADNSNYWQPSVYKVNYDDLNGNVSFSPIWGRSRIYYNFPQLNSGSGPGTYIEPFPYDFQMISGNPSKKTGGGYSQEDLSIFYYCEQDFANGTVNSFTTYAMPATGCSLLVTKVWFPSCWNGGSFELSNPSGHVQFPLIGQGLLGPNCPLGYERRIPGLLIETYYLGTADFSDGPAGPWGDNGDDVPTYILANGDTTGYGLHGDFQNGWNQTVLQQVLDNCTTVEFSDPMNIACPPLNASWSAAAAEDCLINANTTIPDEVMGWTGALTELPGCNLIWGNTSIKPSCPGYEDPRFVQWSTLVGIEDNVTPSPADLANPYLGLGNTTTTTSSAAGQKTVTVTATSTVTKTSAKTVVSSKTVTKTAVSVSTSVSTATTTATTTTTTTATTTASGTCNVQSSSGSLSTSTSSDTSYYGSGVWTSGLPSTTVYISTAKIGGRCAYAAHGTRTICAPTQICKESKSGYSTCATTTATSSAAATTKGALLKQDTEHTGVWTSGLPSTTVYISTASVGERCAHAQFGTRTVCAPTQTCEQESAGYYTCGETTAVKGTDSLEKRGLSDADQPLKTGRRLKRATEGQEL